MYLAGKAFCIMGDWDKNPEPKDKIVIRMPPVGIVYGAGWQPSTEAALDFLIEIITPDVSFLDFGAGTGILSVAASKLGAKKVYAVERNPTTRELADKIFKLNKTLVVWDPEEKVDICIANIGKDEDDVLRTIKAMKIFTVGNNNKVVEINGT